MAVSFTAIGLRSGHARLACAVFLLLGVSPTVWGQTTGTATGTVNSTLPAPARQKPTKPAVLAATAQVTPRAAGVQSGAKSAPVVKAKGPAHVQPAAKSGVKTTAKSVAKPAAAGVAAGVAAGMAAGAVALPGTTAEPTEPASQAEPAKGTSTSMPLPRFAALRSDEVNLRTGPGVRYPIDWVYKRRDLPVKIEREFEVWRLVRDQDDVKGWVHQATLTGRRSFVVTGTERVMRRQSNADSAAVARLQPGVVGHIRGCEAAAQWCQVQVGDYKGWLKRDEFWGMLPNEAIN